jgi:hypothetical protein
MSSTVGAHHNLFNIADGLNPHAAAPSHPPIIEIVAAGFLRLTHEQTVSLLKTITMIASVITKPNNSQRPVISMLEERVSSGFLQLYAAGIFAKTAPAIG